MLEISLQQKNILPILVVSVVRIFAQSAKLVSLTSYPAETAPENFTFVYHVIDLCQKV